MGNELKGEDQIKNIGALDWRRALVGLLAIGFSLIGISLGLSNSGSATGLQGVSVRLGVVLAVIWLAMPQLGGLNRFQSVGAMLILFALIVLAASRPSVFRVAVSIVAVGLTFNWLLSRFSSSRRAKTR